MGKTFLSLEPIPGDTMNVLAAKILQSYGGDVEPGDSDWILFRKIALAVGANPRPGDTFVNLLQKILRALGGDPKPGDSAVKLLRKIVKTLTSEEPSPATSMWDLLAAWLRFLESGGIPVPNVPVAQNATGVTQQGFTANWDPSAGATSYRLDISAAADFSSFILNNQNVGNVTSYAAPAGNYFGQTLYYRVRARNVSGTSASSNVITVNTLAQSNDSIVLFPSPSGLATIVNNPVGDLDYTGQAWLETRILNCPNIGGLAFNDNPDLATFSLTNSPVDSLSLSLTGLTSLDLTGIGTVINVLSIGSNASLASIDVSSFQTAGEISIAANDNLATVTFTNLTSADVVSITANGIMTSFSAPVLASIPTSANFDSNGQMTTVNLPSLTSVGTLDLTGLAVLTSPDFSALTTVTADLEVSNCGAVVTMNWFPVLATVGSGVTVQFLDNATSVSFAALSTALSLIVSDSGSLTTLDLSALTQVTNEVVITNVTSLATIDLSALENMPVSGGTFQIFDTNITSLTFPSLAGAPACDWDVSSNDGLTTFSINGQQFFDNGETLMFTDNALSEASVDLILQAAVDGNMMSGNIQLQGGTNSPPSGGTGSANALILQGNGVTVNTN